MNYIFHLVQSWLAYGMKWLVEFGIWEILNERYCIALELGNHTLDQ